MSRYKAYAEYKDSGVELLEKIPLEWNATRIKFISTLNSSKAELRNLTPETEVTFLPMEAIGEQGLLDTSRTKRLGDVLDGYTYIGEGDVCIAKITPCFENGKGAVVTGLRNGIAFATTEVIPLRCHLKTDSKFLYYILTSAPFNKNAEGSMYGAGGQKRVSDNFVANYHVAMPPEAIRPKIAKFLDHETAKIDALIEKQQELIKLLKEKRQAVISHAVTKGLNPNAPMRDSGVEWLGEVPAHWEMLKGAYIGGLFGSESVLDTDVMDEGDIPFIKVSTLDIDSFNLGTIEFFLNSRTGKNIRTNSDYIVFPKRGAAIFTNKVNIVSRTSVIDPNLMGWAIGDRARTEFVAHLLKFRGLKDIADVSTVPQINNKHIEPMKFPIPPIDEQDEIIKFLRDQLERFNNLSGKADDAIELLQERRTALISAAVTGKIDVRDWQPSNTSTQTKAAA